MVCTEAAWSEGVSTAGVREVLKAEGETEDSGCGKKFHEYEKQQGGWCGQKRVSQIFCFHSGSLSSGHTSKEAGVARRE